MTCKCGMQFCYICGGNYPDCYCKKKINPIPVVQPVPNFLSSSRPIRNNNDIEERRIRRKQRRKIRPKEILKLARESDV